MSGKADVRVYTRKEEEDGRNIEGPQRNQHFRSPWFADLLPNVGDFLIWLHAHFDHSLGAEEWHIVQTD